MIDGLPGARTGHADLDADEGRVDRTGRSRVDRESLDVGGTRGGDRLHGRRGRSTAAATTTAVAAATAACGQEPKLDQSKSNELAHGFSSLPVGGYQLMSLTEKFCGSSSGAHARPENARM